MQTKDKDGNQILRNTIKVKFNTKLDEWKIWQYVTDLHHLLSNSELAKRKSFIRSFVKEVKVTGEEVLITYKLPMLPKGVLEEKLSVLPTGHVGGLACPIGRTKTGDRCCQQLYSALFLYHRYD
jgi:hypothetical protein